MKDKFYVLIVDDHPMTVSAYIDLLKSNFNSPEYEILTAKDCQSAIKTLNHFEKLNSTIDIALIDINIPPFPEEKLLSGTDIAIAIRNSFPDCLIIMLTMHTEGIIINNAFKQVNPEGFLCKNDIDFEDFISIFKKIIAFEKYFSNSISNTLNELIQKNRNWDSYDTQILLYLEKGILTKDLPNYIDLSLSSIEKRKALLKKEILDTKGTDKELIAQCKLLKLI